jgi:predicted CXXCH cytochrome family protein
LLTRLLLLSLAATPAAGSDAAPGYVGTAACATCHPDEAKRWQGSHHELAMQLPTPRTVLGNFAGATFSKDGVTSTFFRRDGQYVVRTDGPDGALHDYRVAYTFGVDPLQQYLLELPNGRLQALGIAWDTRPKAAGGQRWFDLYPKEHIDHRDVLHWTGPMQNWNFMCAECHSTGLRKNYRAEGERFETTWSDLDVGCEACHGPGAQHVAWVAAYKEGHAAADPRRGFAVALADTGAWELAAGASIAHRSGPPSTRAEVAACARCHSRHAQIADDDGPTGLDQTRRVALLEQPLYHADGQILDEVYEYGSFVQSRMFAVGVTCSNCHDPHSLRLRAQGNALCAQCHVPAVFDTPQHHYHPAGSAGARCVSCHMAERTYMVIDGRRDHSFRVPRPDLSLSLGTPNACTDCHADKSARWAADAVAGWYGPQRRQGWHYGDALAAGRSEQPDAERQLLRVTGDPAAPAIARATAVALLEPLLSPRSLPALQAAARDPDPLVRRAAAESAAALDPDARLALVAPLLDDPVRTVRLAAFSTLLEVPTDGMNAAQRAALDRVAAEYRAAQRFNADRAEGQTNLGTLEARTGNLDAARAAFDTAIRLQPSFLPAYVNLAEVQRRQGHEADAEATLRRALAVDPSAAAVHHALGLSLVRQGRTADAIAALRRAAELAPDEPRYAYVLAIALHDSGDPAAAIAVLAAAHQRRPARAHLLAALVQFNAEIGDRDAAQRWQDQLRALTGP